ncbi:MAG: DUF222 domain-containing protein, partial [Microbacteriaceae bacterium]|nr:DUF222 domain-containing protein [Microbacteriaceae bacterium]
MGIPITSTPTFVAELDSVVSRLEDVERRARALDAERMKLMAAAFDIAVLHNDEADTDDYTFIPEGRSGEIAYRSIRAEIATSMRLSETTIDRKLSHAHVLTLHYPRVLDSLARGLINERHVSTILDAAEVIGFSADPEHEARRASYETAVLKVAEG